MMPEEAEQGKEGLLSLLFPMLLPWAINAPVCFIHPLHNLSGKIPELSPLSSSSLIVVSCRWLFLAYLFLVLI